MTNAPIVLITGCSSGIGRALAHSFHARGARVVATARDAASLEDLRRLGMSTLDLDVLDEVSVSRAFQRVESEFGRLDILVNNAGYGLMGPVVDFDEEELVRQFRTNVFSIPRLCRHGATLMRRQGSGVIANVGSVSGLVITPFAGAYCASKAAVHALSDALRMELAPFGIQVVTVQPGAIQSHFGTNAEAHAVAALKPGSWYEPLRQAILARAQASQQRATPSDEFADWLAGELLHPHPPIVLRGGANSSLMVWMQRLLPRRRMDRFMAGKFQLPLLSRR